MSTDFFDGLDKETAERPRGPIWTLVLDKDDPKYDEKKILDWLNQELEFILSENKPRFEEIKRNRELYKGQQYERQNRENADRYETGVKRVRNATKVVANYYFDLTQNHVSRLIKYKPAVEIDAAHDEFDDKIAMKGNKILLSYLWYLNNYEDHIEREIARLAKLDGESYLYMPWDPDRGEFHPSYIAAKKKAEESGSPLKVPLVDDDGNPVKDEDGNPIFITDEIHIGDVAYEVKTTFECLLERVKRFEDVKYCFIRERLGIELAKIKYPGLAKKLEAVSKGKIYDFDKMEMVPSTHEVDVWHFYHIKFKGLPDGSHIIFTSDAIGDNEPYEFTHKDKAVGQVALPIERFTDVDVPGELHGWSYLTMVKSLISTYNHITNGIRLNQIRYAQPKWMAPSGSFDIAELVNDSQTVVRFKGPTPPQLVQMNPTPAELFKFRDDLREEFRGIAGFTGVSQGEPPPGIKAGVALQFLSEQENERFNESALKIMAFRKGVAIKTLNACGDKYEDDDGRLIPIFGKHNQIVGRLRFKADWLGRPKHVRVMNSSALPSSKAARIQTLLDISSNPEFAGKVDPDQVLDLMDLAQSDKFMDIATVSVRAAESENDDLLDGKDVLEPPEWEDFVSHWKIHVRAMQEYTFAKLPMPIQAAFHQHVMTTEMLMYEKAQKNPLYGQMLAALPLYPVAYEPPPPPPMMGPPGAPPPDAGAAPMPMDPSAMPPGPPPGAPPQAFAPPDLPAPMPDGQPPMPTNPMQPPGPGNGPQP